MLGRPRVSVVIPCYNYGRYLPDAVHSALDQVDVDVDVVIVDDASSDDSLAVANVIAEQDPRVTVVAHEHNLGHLATYNDGLARVRGTYVVLLSADDMLAPGALGRATALLEHRPDVGLVYGFAADFSDRVPAVSTRRRSNWSVWAGREWVGLVCRRGHNVITNPEVVMRRQVLKDAGFYDPRQPHTADMYLWLRAACLSNVGRINGPDQAYYRVHGTNMHSVDFGSVLIDIRQKKVMFDYFMENGGADIDQKWAYWANRCLGREALRIACSTLDGTVQADRHQADEYVAFAVDTWPAITETALFRSYRRRLSGRLPQWRRQSFAVVCDVRNRLRWRRKRYYGT